MKRVFTLGMAALLMLAATAAVGASVAAAATFNGEGTSITLEADATEPLHIYNSFGGNSYDLRCDHTSMKSASTYGEAAAEIAMEPTFNPELESGEPEVCHLFINGQKSELFLAVVEVNNCTFVLHAGEGGTGTMGIDCPPSSDPGIELGGWTGVGNYCFRIPPQQGIQFLSYENESGADETIGVTASLTDIEYIGNFSLNPGVGGCIEGRGERFTNGEMRGAWNMRGLGGGKPLNIHYAE